MPLRSPKAPSPVLDSWSVLAWLAGEPGADRVQKALEQAETSGTGLPLSIINAGEVYYRLAKGAGRSRADEFAEDLRRHRLPVRLIPASTRRVWEAARVKARYPIAYADAFAAALARETGAPLLTGDSDFRAVERDGYCAIVWLAKP